ncbi:head completion/stabilization protein [Paraburkholderia phytofirmans]|uniref:head completion/stabilization protein n=1 Tax=Paraburkholderia phytofirmans TaxID=261302 RepID=UPI001313FA9B
MREPVRLHGTVANDRLPLSNLDAIMTINGALASLRSVQLVAGYADLAANAGFVLPAGAVACLPAIDTVESAASVAPFDQLESPPWPNRTPPPPQRYRPLSASRRV